MLSLTRGGNRFLRPESVFDHSTPPRKRFTKLARACRFAFPPTRLDFPRLFPKFPTHNPSFPPARLSQLSHPPLQTNDAFANAFPSRSTARSWFVPPRRVRLPVPRPSPLSTIPTCRPRAPTHALTVGSRSSRPFFSLYGACLTPITHQILSFPSRHTSHCRPSPPPPPPRAHPARPFQLAPLAAADGRNRLERDVWARAEGKDRASKLYVFLFLFPFFFFLSIFPFVPFVPLPVLSFPSSPFILFLFFSLLVFRSSLLFILSRCWLTRSRTLWTGLESNDLSWWTWSDSRPTSGRRRAS